METLFDESEENQIRGIRYVLDVSNIRMKHYFVLGIGTWIRIMKHIEVGFLFSKNRESKHFLSFHREHSSLVIKDVTSST
jgi:hypothetical protein